MPRCSAPGCSNKHEKGVRLFRWPADPVRAQQWLKNCGAGCKTPTASSRICHEHFDIDQFEANRQDGWHKLKPNAVPSIFSTNPTACLRTNRNTLIADTSSLASAGTSRNPEKGDPKVPNVSEDIQCQPSLYRDGPTHKDSEECLDECLTTKNGDSSFVTLDLQVSSSEDRQKLQNEASDHDPDQLSDENNSAAASETNVAGEHTYSQQNAMTVSRIYECPFCHKLLGCLLQLRVHLGRHINRTGVCQCSFCGKELSRPAVLRSHLAIVHPGMSFDDTKLPKTPRPHRSDSVDVTPQTAQKHTKSPSHHHHMCATCGRCFTQSSGLHRHERVHSHSRPYLCPVCGQQFTTCSAFHRHQLVHTGVRPLTCAFCSRGFKHSGDLRKHLRVHLLGGT